LGEEVVAILPFSFHLVQHSLKAADLSLDAAEARSGLSAKISFRHSSLLYMVASPCRPRN
jgi:hypothetical protein